MTVAVTLPLDFREEADVMAKTGNVTDQSDKKTNITVPSE
jgi:hypothetical protein